MAAARKKDASPEQDESNQDFPEAAPAERAPAPKPKPPAPRCDNHPHVQAAHTTGATLHRPMSLCAACLRKAEHMRLR